jgi:uncharacterized protein YdeI (YjbR/CyaY-like superfamily)
MPQKPLSEYEVDIPKVAELLESLPESHQFFTDLTPGYQREWARFIFGVKSEETKLRHIEQMKIIFEAGFKSKRAYDQRAK